jgi:hypothetical protein
VCPKYDENGKLKQEMVLVGYVYLLSSYRTYTLTLPRNAIRMCTLPWTNLGWAPVEFLIQSIHVLAVTFSEVDASIFHARLKFLGD